MGYKILGFVVWQGAKLYLRRRVSGTALALTAAGIGAAVLGGAILAQRQQHSE